MAESTRRTILSIDDEQSILDLIRIEFEDDFDVVTARSGAEALDLLAHQPVDVVLLDLRMPQMAGEEFLRRLNSTRVRPPVVVMSAVRESATASSLTSSTPGVALAGRRLRRIAARSSPRSQGLVT